MAGRPGRSGGHNKIPLEDHILKGTFNVTRHGSRMAALGGPTWSPEPATVAALGPAGQALVSRLTGTYTFTVFEAEVLLEAAVVVDRLHAVRQQRTDAAGSDRVALERLEIGWQKQLITLLASLKVHV